MKTIKNKFYKLCNEYSDRDYQFILSPTTFNGDGYFVSYKHEERFYENKAYFDFTEKGVIEFKKWLTSITR